MNIEKALTIDGFMMKSELEYIAHLAKQSMCIAEIGCFQGRSGRAWADNAAGIVVCVDFWRDGGETNFDANLADVLGSKIFKVRMASQSAAKMFNYLGARFNAIFIDADHDYDNVKADILAWRPLLSEGGILAGHDYQPAFPGVIAAVKELIQPFRVVGGSIWTTEI